jgi:colicin import membrane protein
MSTEIVKAEAQQFGLEESQAETMVSGLAPILDERGKLSEIYSQLIVREIDSDLIKEASALRKRIKENRTKGIEVWHKTNKEVFLRGGQFVDAIKRREVSENERMESKLEEIELFFVNQEKQRIAKMQLEREAELSQYEVENVSALRLGEMESAVYSAFLIGAKSQYETRKEEERKAEEDRIAREKKDAEEREAQRIENERLRKEAEERAAEFKKERARAEAALKAEREAAAEALRIEREAADAERKRVEAEEADKRRVIEDQARKEREAAAAKAAEEAASRKKLEDELRAKKEAEEKAEADRLAALEAEANKGDVAKVLDLISDLQTIGIKYQFKSKKNQKMYNDVQNLIDKIVTHVQGLTK